MSNCCCNNRSLFSGDWVWIIIAVIVIVCLFGDDGCNNNCGNDRCDCC